ncbi:hypothetical protein RRG08_052575 [Elysia crispata]|uniref:Transglutaminase-like domain-containing protein n=1 Tax=Elysia crispata TaxID=231223 RepID=A0AAE1DRU8_9GAST|nr:hypothetical protein RRG08_052575 [Elysia crispata]
MYGRYRNSTGSSRSYASEPPWATDYFNRATNISNNNTNNSRHNNGRRNNVSHGRTVAGNGGAAERRAANTRHPGYTGYRYGGRTWPRPSFRDYDFWARFRPYAAPHGTDSHRERERARRENRDRGDRRSRMEGKGERGRGLAGRTEIEETGGVEWKRKQEEQNGRQEREEEEKTRREDRDRVDRRSRMEGKGERKEKEEERAGRENRDRGDRIMKEKIEIEDEGNREEIGKVREDERKNSVEGEGNREEIGKVREDERKNSVAGEGNREEIGKVREDERKNSVEGEGNREEIGKVREDERKNSVEGEGNREEIGKVREDERKNSVEGEGNSEEEVRGPVEEERDLVPEEAPLAKNVLTVKSVNLHILQNTKEHKTADYDCTERAKDPRLVVRRGQVFIMTLTFQRPWSSQDDDLFVQFSIGDEPSEKNGTLEKFQLSETDSTRYKQQGRWGAKIAKQDGRQLSIYVYIAPDAIVGEWECQVSTAVVTNSEEVFTYTAIPDIYVLFNPWCSEDQVHYTENPQDLNEYVLNEYGCVFNGMADYIGRKPWFYGQFQDGILEVCMTLLRMAFDLEISKDMGDAVTVARKLSRIINNSAKDPGLITGNWSNNYADGTSPSTWKGSVQILLQYARTKTAVKYGQCWVFSAVLTTVCRALGLPCRSLTNYESAHDTDKTVTIDSYKDENGEDLPEFKSDSIWNYHCWNDVWINRPDLDSTSSSRGRYSGWHALDSTPQEQSGGRYQCGPSPHKAVKSGELSIGHDTGFIFAEVNGEVCTWMLPRGSASRADLKLLSRDAHAVGKQISTKTADGQPARGIYNPGARDVHHQRVDITHLYKHPEGSEEERAALQLAVGRGLGAKIFETPGGVSVDLVKPESVMIGTDFLFTAIFSNTGKEGQMLNNVTLGVFPIDYRGERLGWDKVAYIKMEEVELRPGESRRFELPVSHRSYQKLCDKSMSMMLRAAAKVKGDDKPVTKMEKFILSVPDLKLEVPSGVDRIQRGHAFTVVLVISNPLPRPLTSCRLQITGPASPLPSQGFSAEDGSFSKKIKDIFPSETSVLNVDMQAYERPYLNNTRQIEMSVISAEMPDMEGTLTFKLQR